jgi:hypothetical protein
LLFLGRTVSRVFDVAGEESDEIQQFFEPIHGV